QSLGTAGQTRRAGTRARIEGGHLPGPRGVARGAGRDPRTPAETDGRPVCEPAGGGGEDLRGPEGLRRPPRGSGTPRAAPHRPGPGDPGTGAEAPGPCRGAVSAGKGARGTGKIAPPEDSRAGGPGDRTGREDGETRQYGLRVRDAGHEA